MSLYRDGPDVSEIGSTWLRDFEGMNSVRPFTPLELRALADPADLIPAAWESVSLAKPAQLWAMPWLADTRILYYRRDLLEQAGIDEQNAFHTPEALEQTLARLQAAKVAVPWVVPTRRTWTALHHVASWVWDCGGHFLSPDGKQCLLDQPEARAGLKAYFALGQYLADAGRNLDSVQSEALFGTGQAAVVLSGPWLMQMEPALVAKTGLVLPPGVPFVGGSHLVIWKHSRRAREAVKLVRFLTGLEFQRDYAQRAGLLPVRLKALADSVFPSNAFAGHLTRGLTEGRSFRPVPLWGLVEEKLVTVMVAIWEEVLKSDKPDLDAILDQHLTPLIQRLNWTLGGTGSVR
ncbi:MAG: extracellular solute-binding protein [Chloroflexi bacterium]|nr:extracellular solute-binding protein [Chloroflexota bacterium]